MTFASKLREISKTFHIFLTFSQNIVKEEFSVEKITKIYIFRNFLQVSNTYFLHFFVIKLQKLIPALTRYSQRVKNYLHNALHVLNLEKDTKSFQYGTTADKSQYVSACRNSAATLTSVFTSRRVFATWSLCIFFVEEEITSLLK